MFQSFEDNPVHTDITTLHAEFPGVRWHSYRDWAKTVDWEWALAQKPTWA